MLSRHSHVALAAALVVHGIAVAQTTDLAAPLHKAQQALDRGDYNAAFAEYRQKAEHDANHLAEFSLALFFREGWGRPKDPVAACQWFEKAAAGKLPAAEHFLADCLVDGTHRAPDPAKAAYWYQQAAKDGHSISLCSLAALYVTGRGVARDREKGLALCRGIAQQGNVPAMVRIGRLLLEGETTQQNLTEAYAWFEQAAQRGAAEALYNLGIMNRDGLGRSRNLEIARSLFESAAAQGYIPAYFPTASLYFNAPPDADSDRPRADDLAKAYLWLSATARRSKESAEVAAAEEMIGKTKQIMPATWIPDLNRELDRYLNQHPVP